MTAIRNALMLAALTLSFAGCKPSEQAQQAKAAGEADVKSMEGKYKVASREGTTSEDAADEDKPDPAMTYYFVIENGILREEYRGADGKPEVLSRRKMTVNADARPKTVDLVYVDEAGKELKERTTKKAVLSNKRKVSTTVLKDVGIYNLDGDKLDLCLSWDAKNRPTDFTAPARSSRYLLKLERVTDTAAIDAKTTPATAAR